MGGCSDGQRDPDPKIGRRLAVALSILIPVRLDDWSIPTSFCDDTVWNLAAGGLTTTGQDPPDAGWRPGQGVEGMASTSRYMAVRFSLYLFDWEL